MTTENPHQTPKPDESATAMRKALGIHTWGLDLNRIKRRIGEIMITLDTFRIIGQSFEDRIARLEEKAGIQQVEPSYNDADDT